MYDHFVIKIIAHQVTLPSVFRGEVELCGVRTKLDDGWS